MYRVWLPTQQRWIENVPVTEALVYKEDGYTVLRMDLPYTTPYFSEQEVTLAKKLFNFYKQAMESQGTSYAFWDTLCDRNKRAWLETAKAFLKEQA